MTTLVFSRAGRPVPSISVTLRSRKSVRADLAVEDPGMIVATPNVKQMALR